MQDIKDKTQKYEDIAFEVVLHALTACKTDNARPMKTYYYLAYAGRNMPEYSMRDIARVTAEQWKQAKEVVFNVEHKDLTTEGDTNE